MEWSCAEPVNDKRDGAQGVEAGRGGDAKTRTSEGETIRGRQPVMTKRQWDQREAASIHTALQGCVSGGEYIYIPPPTQP